MTAENQKILYNHYIAVAKNEKKDRGGKDFKPIIRENAQKHADEIKNNYPSLFDKPKEKK